VQMYVPEGENLMPWVGPDGGASRVDAVSTQIPTSGRWW